MKLVLVGLILLATLSPLATAAPQVGACSAKLGWCPGFACVYVGAKYTCANPTLSTPVPSDVCQTQRVGWEGSQRECVHADDLGCLVEYSRSVLDESSTLCVGL